MSSEAQLAANRQNGIGDREVENCPMLRLSSELTEIILRFAGLMTPLRTCPFCRKEFQPSRFHPDQNVCSANDCQQKRRSAFHRKKLHQDPLYAEACRDSRKKWRAKNKPRIADYKKSRKDALASTARDISALRRKELLELIDRCSVFDLRQCTVQVWLLSADDKTQVEKILATADLLILHAELRSSPSQAKG